MMGKSAAWPFKPNTYNPPTHPPCSDSPPPPPELQWTGCPKVPVLSPNDGIAHQGANMYKALGHYWEGLIGATWLPVGLFLVVGHGVYSDN